MHIGKIVDLVVRSEELQDSGCGNLPAVEESGDREAIEPTREVKTVSAEGAEHVRAS